MRIFLPILILSPDGTIAYRGQRGPAGYNVPEMEAALAKLLDPAKPARWERCTTARFPLTGRQRDGKNPLP